MSQGRLRVLVLAGGPDAEREVSLQSGGQIAAALEQAGHEVRQRDVGPNDLAALDEFADWPGDVVFPALHGRWGEGGALQRILDERGVRYVGSDSRAASLCIDKVRTKRRLIETGLPTPEFEVARESQVTSLSPPVVVKPIDEGSSIDLAICRTVEQLDAARRDLHERHRELLVERFIQGRELTVGVLDDRDAPEGCIALPVIEIVPATEFYDYEAKYSRDDTQYRFEIDLPGQVIARMQQLAVETHCTLGARHLSRVDFMVDREHRPWILEINTLPGFTTHSLLPMAARRAGIDMPELVDRLVRLALSQ